MEPVTYKDVTSCMIDNRLNHVDIVYIYSITMYVQVADRIAELKFIRIDGEDVENSEFEDLKMLRDTDFNLKELLESIIKNEQLNIVSVSSYFS